MIHRLIIMVYGIKYKHNYQIYMYLFYFIFIIYIYILCNHIIFSLHFSEMFITCFPISY